MSTCSTATSALRRGHENRRRRRRASPASCDAADVDVDAVGSLERRLVDLERDWDAYKSGRSSPPPRRRRRRSRSVTGTPSSAVTVAAAPDGLFLLPLYRCSSPRTLISSLQQTSSADGAAEIVVAAGSPYKEEGLSSVCSVEEPGRKNSAAAPAFSSCSCCPCRCTVCGVGYSSASSSGSAAGGGTAGERARKNDEGREVAGTCRAAWISAVVGLVIMGFVFVVAMAVLELGVGDGCAEYLVPT
ncbi:unnamed protein product [Urochloa humidicola]